MSGFKFDDGAIQRITEQATAKLQVQFNEALRATIREVRDEMSGQPVEVVEPALKARLTQKIPSATWNDPELRKFAESISAGTLED